MMLTHTKQTHIGTKRKQMNGQTLNRGPWVGIGLFSLAVFLGGFAMTSSVQYEMRVVSWRQWCR
jgi:hypothetical protein